MRRCLPFVAMLALSPLALASTGVDLSLNDNAARLTVDYELSNNLRVDGTWFHHTDRGDIFGAGLHLTGEASGGPNPLKAGLGARLLRVDPDARNSGFAIPIGGFVNYTLPEYDRFVVGGSIYYAPDVLSFDDVTRYWEYNAWVGYSVLRQGLVYLGVRGIDGGFKRSRSLMMDSGMHIGLRIRF